MVERGGLENRYTFTGIEGSNPSLSAIRIALIQNSYSYPERWPSGLRRTLGKRVYVNAYRGFESHSLRQSARPTALVGIASGSVAVTGIRVARS